jgi:hypothetical protein
MAPQADPPLLTQRAALVLLVAFIVGILADVLAYLARSPLPTCVMVGGAFGGALMIANNVIGR